MKTSMKEKLEIATNALIIVVVLLLGVSYVRSRVTNTGNSLGPSIGEKISPPKNYDWHAYSQTLMIAVRKGCVYCERSYPLYRRLDSLGKDHLLKAHLLFVTPDDPITTTLLLSSERINSQSIANILLTDFKISGTPTLLLVDADGRVLQSWIGELGASEAEALVTQLRR